MSKEAARARKRYAEDPEYRKRRLASINRWRKANKTEINAKRRLRWATDPDYRERTLTPKRGRWRREYDLKRLYGITLADYERMFKKQKGRCAICKEKSRKRLQVDHDHLTKEVRRLLCGPCNRGMGCFRDNLRILRGAVAYRAAMLKLQRRGKPRGARGGKSTSGKSKRKG
jgi:Recombination endonuclease VII